MTLEKATGLDLRLIARVFGDNIATPIDVPVTIAIETAAGWLDDEDADGSDDEGDDH